MIAGAFVPDRLASAFEQNIKHTCPLGRGEQPIMVKSKTKREKPVETTEEFVARVNAEARKRNGLKKNLKGARR